MIPRLLLTKTTSAPYLTHSKGTVDSFVRAVITFEACYARQFDQAGILLKFSKPATGERKWIKSGVELFDNRARLSTVCTDNYSDWSVSDAPRGDEIRAGARRVTVSVERNVDETGQSLWVYHVEGGGKTPLREINWPYGTATAAHGWELQVAATVARDRKSVV